jgi:hypothetical protein
MTRAQSSSVPLGVARTSGPETDVRSATTQVLR